MSDDEMDATTSEMARSAGAMGGDAAVGAARSARLTSVSDT